MSEEIIVECPSCGHATPKRMVRTRPSAALTDEENIKRWKAEELEWQKWEVRYRAAIIGLLSNPYGCSLCDSGKPRNPAKGHQPDCPYEAARACLPPDELAACVRRLSTLPEAGREATLRAYEMVRAELAAEAMTAGEETGSCDTCASFDMTGWSMETVNAVLDRLKAKALGHTFGKEGCFCRPTIKGRVKTHDLSTPPAAKKAEPKKCGHPQSSWGECTSLGMPMICDGCAPSPEQGERNK